MDDVSCCLSLSVSRSVSLHVCFCVSCQSLRVPACVFLCLQGHHLCGAQDFKVPRFALSSVSCAESLTRGSTLGPRDHARS